MADKRMPPSPGEVSRVNRMEARGAAPARQQARCCDFCGDTISGEPYHTPTGCYCNAKHARMHGLSKYEPVAERIVRFYDKYKMGRIETVVVGPNEPGFPVALVEHPAVVIRASVYRDVNDEKPTGTGIAFEVWDPKHKINAGNFLENCETSAIGRALGAAGFPGHGKMASAEEMEKQDRMVDVLSENETLKLAARRARAIAVIAEHRVVKRSMVEAVFGELGQMDDDGLAHLAGIIRNVKTRADWNLAVGLADEEPEDLPYFELMDDEMLSANEVVEVAAGTKLKPDWMLEVRDRIETLKGAVGTPRGVVEALVGMAVKAGGRKRDLFNAVEAMEKQVRERSSDETSDSDRQGGSLFPE